MEEPGGLQSMGSHRVGHDWATSLSLFTFMHWRRKWQPTPMFLPGESQGRGSLVGCRLWGHRVRPNWSDLAAAARDHILILSLPFYCSMWYIEKCRMCFLFSLLLMLANWFPVAIQIRAFKSRNILWGIRNLYRGFFVREKGDSLIRQCQVHLRF